MMPSEAVARGLVTLVHFAERPMPDSAMDKLIAGRRVPIMDTAKRERMHWNAPDAKEKFRDGLYADMHETVKQHLKSVSKPQLYYAHAVSNCTVRIQFRLHEAIVLSSKKPDKASLEVADAVFTLRVRATPPGDRDTARYLMLEASAGGTAAIGRECSFTLQDVRDASDKSATLLKVVEGTDNCVQLRFTSWAVRLLLAANRRRLLGFEIACLDDGSFPLDRYLASLRAGSKAPL
jgi:hypothetical protein